MTPARKKALEIVGSCTCHEGYKSRKLRDPTCAWCEHGAAVAEVIEASERLKTKYDRLLAAAKAAEEHTWGDEGQAQEILADAIREAEGDGTKKEAEQ